MQKILQKNRAGVPPIRPEFPKFERYYSISLTIPRNRDRVGSQCVTKSRSGVHFVDANNKFVTYCYKLANCVIYCHKSVFYTANVSRNSLSGLHPALRRCMLLVSQVSLRITIKHKVFVICVTSHEVLLL